MPFAPLIAVGTVLVVATSSWASGSSVPGPGAVREQVADTSLDPRHFFDRLVARYRGLIFYSDRVRVVQVTQRPDSNEQRVETQIACEVREGKLRVATPASQMREGLGLNVPIRSSSAMDDLELRYGLWLAPHMALKFTEEPLKQLREGVEREFRPTTAQPVTIDERPMVNLELKSGSGQSADYEARVNLYVDPDSMLIERIESEQRLPDGASYQTTLDIDPDDEVEPIMEPLGSAEPIEPPPPDPAGGGDWSGDRPAVDDVRTLPPPPSRSPESPSPAAGRAPAG